MMDRMKSPGFILVMAVVALSFSACGGGSSASRSSAANEWTWANGPDVVDQWGIYGTQMITSPNDFPGARQSAVSWVDKAGNLWLFGGYGYDSAGHSNVLNDLWEYSAGQWTWISGVNVVGEPGIYGTLGTAALTNVPGARQGAVSWTDAAGNFWLFGGYGYGSSPNAPDILNDLWEYSAGEWIWMGGSNTSGQPGTYGTEGMAAPGNIPGARFGAVSWTDSSGNFWLFGGNGSGSAGNSGNLNDLWEYSAGEWTWMGGSDMADQQGTYGTEGMGAPGNIPGARFGAVSWADTSGNFWLFSGSGYDSAGATGNLNDLWEYSAGQWTWMGGSNVNGQSGTYGSEGTAAQTNIPGARNGGVSWTDMSGNLWLFGGSGYDSMGNSGWLNDLWEYSAGQWTWVSGSNVTGQLGTYGSMGAAAHGSVPGARTLAVSWIDASGNLHLFGGIGDDSIGANGFLDDSWSYEP